MIILITKKNTGAIDLAFVDRADIKQYIGNPGVNAIYEILSSCMNELMRVEIIQPSQQILHFNSLNLFHPLEFKENKNSINLNENFNFSDSSQFFNQKSSSVEEISKKLSEIACEAHKISLSARNLRKLPFLALSSSPKKKFSLHQFLDLLLFQIQKTRTEKEFFLN